MWSNTLEEFIWQMLGYNVYLNGDKSIKEVKNGKEPDF
jgi:hypothetical protein